MSRVEMQGGTEDSRPHVLGNNFSGLNHLASYFGYWYKARASMVAIWSGGLGAATIAVQEQEQIERLRGGQQIVLVRPQMGRRRHFFNFSTTHID